MSFKSILFGKSKMSCQELADMLAPRFTKLAVEMFETNKETRGEHSWSVQAARGKCRTDPLREWALFYLAAYINGCRSSMKQDATYFELLRAFLATSARNFVERGIFSTEAECEQLAKDRLADYLEGLQEGSAERNMQSLARKFLRNLGCTSDDVIYRIEAVGSFVSYSIATRKMFDNILKTTRLTL